MLHELLLSLLGYTGDFVIDEREHLEALGIAGRPIPDNSPTFRLASDLTFIQPSQRSVIEELLPLGYYYRELDRFTTVSRNLSSIRAKPWVSLWLPTPESSKGEARRASVYWRAIANGIVEVLSVYRSAVLQVEQKLLSDPDPVLATVTQGLNKFLMLLPPLHELLNEIECNDIRGGRLLNLLYKRCHCGVPELQVCIQRLLWHGHQVLYNQLASWMVYGILHDPHGEFFIRREQKRDDENELSHSDGLKRVNQKSSDDASLTDWHLGFHIFLDMLPEYISMRTAESILFSGKAIRVLRNPSVSFRFPEDNVRQPIQKRSHMAQGFFGSFACQSEIPVDTHQLGEELLPQSEAYKIDSMLQELKKSSEFHKRSFECTVDSVRTIAANHLWQLVVIRADLNGHLKALKDYFLLAKGDFFQCFLEESRKLMRLPPRQSTAEADLMIPFQLASLKTISDEDKYFSRVSLRMASFGSSQMNLSNTKVQTDGSSVHVVTSSDFSVDGWDGISLEYSVNWPLQLFFTQEVLSKYCRVFQYLIRLKRTQMELEKSWASVMHQGHTDFTKHRKDRKDCTMSQQHHQQSPMWRVREHMAFLIRNLQFYIQVDVVESQWNILQGHIQDSRDFTELVGFHQEYLAALISQSFLDIGSVSRILDSIMKLCLQFCWIIERHEGSSNSPELDHITEEFNKKSNSLYTILRSSRLAGSQRAPYLRRFLMRLNFNSFFESTARGVLNIVRSRPAVPIFQQ